MPAPKLSIVMPVYNESAVIAQVVREHVELMERLQSAIGDWEIICLDDSSQDESFSIIRAIAAQNPRVVALRNERNCGIVKSFSRLFMEAKGDYIYATGADGQWPAENCRIMWERLQSTSADMVIGVRTNREQVYTLWRRILSYGFNFLSRVLFKLRTEDANSIKLGRREIFQSQIRSQSFFAEIERIIQARDNGFVIEFVPILFLSRTNGKASGAKWNHVMATIRDMLKYVLVNH